MEIEHSLSEGSGLGEALKPTDETEPRISGSDGMLGENEQGTPDMEPSVARELEHHEPSRGEESLSENEQSEGHSELDFRTSSYDGEVKRASL
jgi:hypothetical protein